MYSVDNLSFNLADVKLIVFSGKHATVFLKGVMESIGISAKNGQKLKEDYEKMKNQNRLSPVKSQ